MNGHLPFPELVVRPVQAGDAERVRHLFDRLSPETIYRRFFTLFPDPPPAVLRYLSSADHRDHRSLVALDGDDIVAEASWDRVGPDRHEAELAVLVEDAWQHRGLGRALMRMLTADAARQGIETLTATVQTENTPARRLATGLARPEQVEIDGPATSFRFRVAS